MHHSRRLLATLGLGLTILGLIVAPIHQVFAQGGTPPSSPVALPDTPVGEQLAWLLSQFNGDADQLTEEDIAERFDPAFLATLPAQVLVGLIHESATEYAPFELTGFVFPPSETAALALVKLGDGTTLAITITVSPESPHRITRLELGEPPPPLAPTGQRVDIGERSLYLECMGEGSPTVVLEGGVTTDWDTVQSTVSEETRVCSYDRPDSPQSRSDPTPERNAQEVVDDLHALLTESGESGPYVLVGHSMGGLYVQLYAYQHPEEIAGLVLVDPTPENFSRGLMDLLTSLGTPVPADSGPVTAEQISFQQMTEARDAGTCPQVPMVVMSHGLPPTAEERPPGWPLEDEEALFRQLQLELVDLVPGTRHVVADLSKHAIHQEEPNLVSTAIIDVVNAVRDPATWATPSPGS
jgi:pimeloyl-ACP methyl ester carboxylesterase